MDLPEARIHSFVVRIWLEDAARGDKPAVWRSHISHVPSGEQQYARTLRQAMTFINRLLESAPTPPEKP